MDEGQETILAHLTPSGEVDEGPIIQAAGESETTELKRLLDLAGRLPLKERKRFVLDFVWSEPLGGVWDTPLLRAIRNERSDNVDILLRAGADPNGISTFWQETYSFGFRRVVVGDMDLRAEKYTNMTSRQVGSPETQLLPLAQEELDSRRDRSSRFWCGPEDLNLEYAPNGEALHSVALAGGTSKAILNRLLQAGADISF